MWILNFSKSFLLLNLSSTLALAAPTIEFNQEVTDSEVIAQKVVAEGQAEAAQVHMLKEKVFARTAPKCKSEMTVSQCLTLAIEVMPLKTSAGVEAFQQLISEAYQKDLAEKKGRTTEIVLSKMANQLLTMEKLDVHKSFLSQLKNIKTIDQDFVTRVKTERRESLLQMRASILDAFDKSLISWSQIPIAPANNGSPIEERKEILALKTLIQRKEALKSKDFVF